ncbi:MAG: glycosyltransferase family 9 protein [bacterium]
MSSSAATILDSVREGGRIALVRLRSLGDCVLTTPAIALLHQWRPDLQIAVVVENRFRAIFEGLPAVSAILPPEYRAIAAWHPRVCVNLHGGTRSMLLTLASAARIRAGFAHHRGASLVYNVRIPRAQEIIGDERPVHTAEHLASAMFHLGVPVSDPPRACLFAKPLRAERPYAVVHPAAAAAYKTWPAERFLAAARHIAAVHRLEPVFIGGAADDLTPFREFRSVVGAPIGEVKNLLAGASLFIGNDSGPAHMAAAFGVPVVVLFGRLEHSVTWAPWRARAARTLASGNGIAAIPVAAALRALDEVAAEAGVSAPRD